MTSLERAVGEKWRSNIEEKEIHKEKETRYWKEMRNTKRREKRTDERKKDNTKVKVKKEGNETKAKVERRKGMKGNGWGFLLTSITQREEAMRNY